MSKREAGAEEPKELSAHLTEEDAAKLNDVRREIAKLDLHMGAYSATVGSKSGFLMLGPSRARGDQGLHPQIREAQGDRQGYR